MKALNRLLLRDLLRLGGQAITIALVVAAGVAAHVALLSAWASLHLSRERFYEEQRFGDVFAELERAPLSVAGRLEEIEGVRTVMTRVSEPVRVPIEGISQPPLGRLVSLPDEGEPPLGDLRMISGRLPEPGREDEAVLLSKFARVQGIESGDEIPVVVRGVLRRLRIVGTAASPEFIYTVPAGELSPDDERYGVFWMRRTPLARMLALEGAFDEVVLRLEPGASLEAVKERVDHVLEPYGGLGSVGRDKQSSNEAVEGEMQQLRGLANVIPPIFLLVAAFLMNVVLSRLVLLQRAQIATLKALGYGDLRIGLHYLSLVSLVAMLGVLLGTGAGASLGRALTSLYAEVFGFPDSVFVLTAGVVLGAAAVGLVAAAVGALVTVRQVSRLTPAEAMRPAAPARHRKSFIESLGFEVLFGTTARMVVREITRYPLRNMMSVLAIALSVSVLVIGRFYMEAVDAVLDLQFRVAMREDLSVAFERPVPGRAVHSLSRLPGVVQAEGQRTLLVRFSSEHHTRDGLVTGFEEGSELRRPVDTRGRTPELPISGALISSKLAEALGIGPGDELGIEVREGERQRGTVRVVGLVDDMAGLQAYMRLEEVHALLGEQDGVSSVLLRLESGREDEVEGRLMQMPTVLSVSSRPQAVKRFRSQMEKTVVMTTLVITIFAATIAIGVVYNDARISLSTRERELASLRVLGFTRREISEVLLGELFLRFVLAIGPGLYIGRKLAALIAASTDPERFRLPLVITSRTDAFAVAVAFAAALASALLVRRRLDRLDLIGVLKTRE